MCQSAGFARYSRSLPVGHRPHLLWSTRAITGVYNAMSGTSLLVHHSQRPFVPLVQDPGSTRWLGTSNGHRHTHGSFTLDGTFYLYPHMLMLIPIDLKCFSAGLDQLNPLDHSADQPVQDMCLLFLAPSLVLSCVHRAGMPSWPPCLGCSKILPYSCSYDFGL